MMKPIKVWEERACFLLTDPLRGVSFCVSPWGEGEREKARGREKERETGRERESDCQWGGFSIWDKCKLQLEHRAGSPEG